MAPTPTLWHHTLLFLHLIPRLSNPFLWLPSVRSPFQYSIDSLVLEYAPTHTKFYDSSELNCLEDGKLPGGMESADIL